MVLINQHNNIVLSITRAVGLNIPMNNILRIPETNISLTSNRFVLSVSIASIRLVLSVSITSNRLVLSVSILSNRLVLSVRNDDSIYKRSLNIT